MCELLEVAWPKQMIDVGERGFRKQAQALGFDAQYLLAPEPVGRDEIGCQLPIRGFVLGEGK
jgi:hypothetical protein